MTELQIEHCATIELLSSDFIKYGNQFGAEFEVSSKRHNVMRKPQQLDNERVGKKVIDLTMKPVNDCNIWQIITATDPAAARPVEVEQVSYDAATLMNDVKSTLASRGFLGLREVSSVFKMMDRDNNRQVDAEELERGLANFGLNLNPKQVAIIINYFDRDGSKTISLSEFLRGLRVSNFSF